MSSQLLELLERRYAGGGRCTLLHYGSMACRVRSDVAQSKCSHGA